ncbi:MAG: HlyD family secretion protein [Bacteroidales bacterium]|nr:HlyD family secretion protein [Bacteroidales bacterium]MBD5230500.1 HlyD family secretion protein [Bacteroidales bacterium]MBD5235916.1 HlyD family secretion protein [Barnesiella sp.]MBD5247603.1 HlyD family secretion protein [Barnesiella sp.]
MKHRSKKIISYIITLAVIIAAALWVGSKFIHLGNVEFTDNASVSQQIVPVNSRVQGYIKEIRFKEYEQVKKGDTLVIIDDADLRLNVARAKADYANALAGRLVADRSVASASANVAVSEASIAEAKVLMEMAATDLARYEKLLVQDAVTRQQYDGAKTDYEAKKARYEMLTRQRGATSSVVDVNRQRISQSEAGIELAKAMLETAELNLSYAVIVAPCDGYTSRKEIQVGQLVQPGQTLLDIVDTGDVWVTANYKETQLKHIAPGSEVDITVDAIPDVTFTGRVESISTATGAALSLLPQDNSAGNFVKVRQRIPVRIEFSPDNKPAEMAKIRAGMNVECRVRY